ncbi:UDP-N-acetylmuramoylalanyl-D-glutamyl-2,6-diaminopimelate--D-alanyl-D-alanine ligase [Azospirillum sp. RWY-5-1]|uniref:UDP-N-acetylmuramoyl-tripeptide--D-alanyl-D-alanine ligase n=1 Tax=Azospirillum oleiclasticum TaxID=2735135 RepID=A0ABX2TCA9_9PROT|nr:UDP-N-acetylmuramoylalanyl-D-glutamyl-2,6-diaminopimelate--D-alanyl-D-alanine ligase [Azospirillum oleiclasticum]NYZ15716.1 UDP-N-acetylmuramoylalanyl-D-glutamyl-2,6-diaminopimelate--D-alanyl-D-alanine ligase [Azospirillum oleiclasticum]NYZ21986.1 UDP-N-acetylmuramoylalanyl-D-glutamyl-2,6-diaminopimelate--D-alanyl-D-alanine ligase [Azospirillum oleiclasticum]
MSEGVGTPVPGTTVLWTAADAAAATGGRATGATEGTWTATGVSIDSRTVAQGDLFVAIRGPNFDGHGFVADALAKGAAAALVDHAPDGLPAGAPLLLVSGDTLDALGALGQAARARAAARVIGVTGSVGKTGTKEALRHVLSGQAPTFATEGSLNNHWGVPLSLARLPAGAAYGVFELGMNHAGELGPLSRQVRPDVAVITTVEAAHLEFFASVEAIADAKAEIFEGVSPQGVAVLNRDNPHFGRLAKAAKAQGIGRVWSFGSQDGADARLVDCSLHATCSAVTAVIKGERLQYCLSLPGRHWVMNSLAVLLAAGAAGADLATAARALSSLQPVKGRGVRQRIQLSPVRGAGAFSLVDESYNASPAAMTAAFEVLGKLDPGAGGRRVAVLGDMRELGARADQLHAALAEPLRKAGVDTVHCCGPHMRALYDKLPPAMRGHWTEASAELAPLVADAVHGGDVVLVKGSAGSRMALVVQALAALDHPRDGVAPAALVNGKRG